MYFADKAKADAEASFMDLASPNCRPSAKYLAAKPTVVAMQGDELLFDYSWTSDYDGGGANSSRALTLAETLGCRLPKGAPVITEESLRSLVKNRNTKIVIKTVFKHFQSTYKGTTKIRFFGTVAELAAKQESLRLTEGKSVG
jgi:hypothetical protein